MKLCLVHTPCVWMTSIPLGLAYLKSYMNEVQPDVAVRILDLNNSFVRRASERLPGLCRRCHRQADPTCVPPELFLTAGQVEAAEAFFTDEQSFADKKRYAANYTFYNEYYSWAMRCLDSVLLTYLKHSTPENRAAVRELLAPDLEAILAERPDLVGFSATTMQIAYSLALAKLIAEEAEIPIVLGGHFVTVYDPKEVMQTNPFVDYIVYKEGEQGLAGLVANLESKQFEDVPNLVYRDAGGQVVVNRERWLLRVNELPFPDFSDYVLDGYYSPSPVVPILSSRGCHWGKCAFCEESTAVAKYRMRTPKNVVDEMQQRVEENGVRYFLFCDQTITATSLVRLADEIIDRGLDVRYGYSGFYASRKVTREVLEKAYASGCRWLYIGVESLTQRLVDLMAKGTEVDHVLEVIRWCREIGILPFASYFFGFPTQTADEVIEEARLCKKHQSYLTLPGDGGQFYLTTDSDIFQHPEKYSVDQITTHISFTSETGKITSVAPTFRAPGLTGSQAKTLFLKTVGDDYPYETGGFWSHLVILGDKDVNLVFPRDYYREHLSNPYRRFFEHVRDNGGVLGGERGPQVGKQNYQLGRWYAGEGDYERAAAAFREAAREFPNSPVALRAEATAQLRLGAFSDAIAAARTAIELGASDPGIFGLLATCLEQNGELREALAVYQQVVSKFPRKRLSLYRDIARLKARIATQDETTAEVPRG